jgi:hypothetical protein
VLRRGFGGCIGIRASGPMAIGTHSLVPLQRHAGICRLIQLSSVCVCRLFSSSIARLRPRRRTDRQFMRSTRVGTALGPDALSSSQCAHGYHLDRQSPQSRKAAQRIVIAYLRLRPEALYGNHALRLSNAMGWAIAIAKVA